MPNLSQQRRERLLAFLQKLKSEHCNDDEALIALNELETELTQKRYGLLWEKHQESVDLMMRENIPVFQNVKEKEIAAAPDQRYNFILEGDNLHSLRLLEKTHTGQIDVIYIDPPYNRGKNDFVYDDNFIGAEDSFKHSKWLSFMEERLRIAARLLSPDGLIFVSIDDNEQAPLKSLMDDIFSEDQFLIEMPRITKKNGKSTGSFSKNHDYVLAYTRQNPDIFSMEEHSDPAFCYEDEWVETRGKYKLNQPLDYDCLNYSISLDYPLELDGETFYPGGSFELWQQRQSGNHKRADWAWRWSRELFEFGLQNGFIQLKRSANGRPRIYTKTYLKAAIKKSDTGYHIEYVRRTRPLSSIDLIDTAYSNDNAKKDLKEFGLEDKFEYPKPVQLIKRLVKSHYNKDAIVLDFFAGSGTTAQAVLELNAEDGGHRNFILCTNNQNNICEEVTYKRCRDVILNRDFETKTRTPLLEHSLKIRDLGKTDLTDQIQELKNNFIGEYDKFTTEIRDSSVYLYGVNVLQKLHGIPANLMYYRTAFVSKTDEDLQERLISHTPEMIQLQLGQKLDGTRCAFVLNEDDADALQNRWKEFANLQALYISRNVLLTSQQNVLFSTVKHYMIPDYYFSPELREAGELW